MAPRFCREAVARAGLSLRASHLVAVLACLLLSACASLKIDGIDAPSLDAALRAEQATPGATRDVCPRLAGDYIGVGEVQAARGDWAWTKPDIAALLRWQGWIDGAAPDAHAARWRVLDADATALIRVQAVSQTGAAIGAPVTPQMSAHRGPSDLPSQGVACIDGALVVRTASQWRIAGETLVSETVTLVLRRAVAGLDVSIYRQRASYGGLLFAVTTRDRGTSRLLFAPYDAAPARPESPQR